MTVTLRRIYLQNTPLFLALLSLFSSRAYSSFELMHLHRSPAGGYVATYRSEINGQEYLASIDDNSEVRWVKELDGHSETIDVIVDKNGGTYILSSSEKNITVDGTPLHKFVQGAEDFAEQFDTDRDKVFSEIIALNAHRQKAYSQIRVTKLTPEGDLDTQFNKTGTLGLDQFHTRAETSGAIALDPQGKIVVSYQVDTNFSNVVVRIHSNGELDHSFAEGGVKTLLYGFQPNLGFSKSGEILIAGLYEDSDVSVAKVENSGRFVELGVAGDLDSTNDTIPEANKKTAIIFNTDKISRVFLDNSTDPSFTPVKREEKWIWGPRTIDADGLISFYTNDQKGTIEFRTIAPGAPQASEPVIVTEHACRKALAKF